MRASARRESGRKETGVSVLKSDGIDGRFTRWSRRIRPLRWISGGRGRALPVGHGAGPRSDGARDGRAKVATSGPPSGGRVGRAAGAVSVHRRRPVLLFLDARYLPLLARRAAVIFVPPGRTDRPDLSEAPGPRTRSTPAPGAPRGATSRRRDPRSPAQSTRARVNSGHGAAIPARTATQTPSPPSTPTSRPAPGPAPVARAEPTPDLEAGRQPRLAETASETE